MPDMKTHAVRTDGGYETSVNWEDDVSVVAMTRKQPNATYGVARLTLAVVEHLQKTPGEFAGALLPERRPEPKNPHHGNLVFRNGLLKRVQRAIAAYLAVNSAFVP